MFYMFDIFDAAFSFVVMKNIFLYIAENVSPSRIILSNHPSTYEVMIRNIEKEHDMKYVSESIS